MTGFETLNPYPEPMSAPDRETKDDSDFSVDSDISDADLQELRKKIKRADPAKVQRDLADVTRALLEATMKKWTLYYTLLLLVP